MQPLACGAVAYASSTARDCLRVRPPVASEAAACVASAARGCLRVWSLLDAAVSTLDRSSICLGRWQRRRRC
ncbi:hypothetical protein GW17_00054070 [Ensete ventricosum]|nr:hypothetical protein GW17_00054070 [Ensete ventricosum]